MDVDIRENGVARQTNPTPVLDGQRPERMLDDVGRQVVAPHQVRDLIATASATLSSGTQATLLAGDTSHFLDLVQVALSNDSTAAVVVTLKDGLNGKSTTLVAPAGSSVVVPFAVPMPASEKGAAWYVDLPDITGTTVYVEALFVKNA